MAWAGNNSRLRGATFRCAPPPSLFTDAMPRHPALPLYVSSYSFCGICRQITRAV
jgi:hypothetical protein